MIIIFVTSGLGLFGGGIQCIEIKMNRNFNELTHFESLELKVPTFVSLRGAFRHAGTEVNPIFLHIHSLWY
jgi:hypothetical protein